MSTLEPRTLHPDGTIRVLTYRTGVQDANLAGNVHGGYIMRLCDDAAGIAASRFAGSNVVTAAVDGMRFLSPVHVGDLVTLRAMVNATWRTSMEVGVRVEAENVRRGEAKHTCTAFFTMVALDENDQPTPLTTTLAPVTAEEQRRYADANERRAARLALSGRNRAG